MSKIWVFLKEHSSCSVERDGEEQKQVMAYSGGGGTTTVAQARDDDGSPASLDFLL